MPSQMGQMMVQKERMDQSKTQVHQGQHKPCSTMSGIWYLSTSCINVSSQWLRQHHPYGLAGQSSHDLCLLLPLMDACGFLDRCSEFLALLASCVFHCAFAFMLTVSHTAPSRAAYSDLEAATHCLASQVFLWNLCGSIHSPEVLIFCIPKKIASCGRCQVVLMLEVCVPGLQNCRINAEETIFF